MNKVFYIVGVSILIGIVLIGIVMVIDGPNHRLGYIPIGQVDINPETNDY